VETTLTQEQAKPRAMLPAQGFTQEAMEALSVSRNEPAWLQEKRREAWAQYQEMDPPLWRRTDISRLKWEELIPYAPPQAQVPDLAALPPKLHDALAVYGQRAGLLLQRDSAAVYRDLDPELQKQGVIWTDMATAVREHSDLVRPHLMQDAVSADQDRYTALHGAFWSGGSFLYVPNGLEVILPFVSVLWMEMPQLAVMPHTLLVAGEGSRVVMVSELLSVGCRACPNTYHGGVSELYIGAGAEVHFINAQDFGRHVYDLRSQTALMDRDSRLEWLTVTLGARVSRSSQHTILRGSGAEALVTGLYLPDGKQHIAFDTLQDHVAGNCQSDLLYQGALLGKSRSVYEGTIRAWPGAQKTNAYQSNRNLILSPGARADSLPKLEIEANDLRCTHGATVSQVDEDQVFYLMSRGIPHADAVRLIVEGFFQPSLDRLPASLGGLHGRLVEAIGVKLAHGTI
jgi:Fe-S cluster assembly protein SufD